MAAKDVLEYVVFEKHLANVYGIWRLHSKIIPDWAPPREPGLLTYRIPPVVEEPEKEAKNSEDSTGEEKKEVTPTGEEDEEKESIYDRFGRLIGRK